MVKIVSKIYLEDKISFIKLKSEEKQKKTNIYNKRELKTLNNTFVVYCLVNYYWLLVIDQLPIGSKYKLSLEDS